MSNNTFIVTEWVTTFKTVFINENQKNNTLETSLIDQLKRKFPKARKNFSALCEGALIHILNDPQNYFLNKAKYHLKMFQLCKQQADFEKEFKKTILSADQRREILTEVIKKKV